MRSTDVDKTGISAQPWRVEGRHIRSNEEVR